MGMREESMLVRIGAEGVGVLELTQGTTWGVLLIFCQARGQSLMGISPMELRM